MRPPEERDHERRDREDQIAAYLDGEMAPDEAAAFANRMRADESLRDEVEQWRDALEAARDWMNADAPGVERVARLDVPSVSRRTAVAAKPARVLTIRLRPLLRRGLVAAAIFIAGVCFGHALKSGTPTLTGGITGTPTVEIPSELGKAAPTPTVPHQPAATEREVAGFRPQQYTDEHGRLVVETTLKDSGARALWVVDGKFQLAQSR